MPPQRAIEGHHDFAVLETRLVALVREVKEGSPGGPFAPLAIVAPTRLLLAHLQNVLARSFPGLLNVHFFHHDSLARAIAGSAGPPLPEPLPDVIREALLARLIEEAGGGLADYIRDRPGGVAALAATLDDLREAGVRPGAARETPDLSRRARDLLDLYAAYARALEGPAARGGSDRAGFLAGVLPRVAAFARGLRRVIHYGAYELIGINLDLLRAFEDAGVPVVYLTPFHRSAPAFAHARLFWSEMMRDDPVEIGGEPEEERLLGERLPLLYDEDAVPTALPAGSVSLFHAQGAESELREVALRVLALHRDHGVPLARIAVVARSLEPYAALLRPVLVEYGLPFTTTASLGAPREPRVQAAIHLARAALGDFERQPLFDLFRSGLFLVKGEGLSRQADAWDRMSREWQVTRGHETWTRHLPEWVRDWEPGVPADADEGMRARVGTLKQARLRQALALAAAVGTLSRAAMPAARARGWEAWTRAMEAAFTSHLDGFREDEGRGLDPGARAVLEVLGGMRDLDLAGLPFSGGGALDWFERDLFEATVPIGSVGADGSSQTGDNGGLRVLDAMQGRGLGFDAVFLIGFNAGLFPRRAAEDPFLDDRDRLLLRARLGRPVPIKSRARDEEHLLLAHLLGSARRWLTVSWQRADESGRARVPSLALREIARVALGAADLARAEEAALRVRTHPREAGEDALERFGLLPPSEAGLNLVLQVRSPGRLLEALDELPGPPPPADRETLAAGLEMLRTIESAVPGDLRYDAFVGDAWQAPAVWSPSRLEDLGACPQYFFFRHALHIEELAEPAEGHEVEAAEIGLRMHRVLHDVYRALVEEGRLPEVPGDPAPAVRQAEEVGRQAWDRHAAPVAARMRPRYPLLWETTSRLWLEALVAFLRRDVEALVRTGGRILGLEKEAPARLSLGGSGATLPIVGRFDRVRRVGEREVVVSDYKTSGRPANHVRPADLLKGVRLQMPLYLLMAESLRPEWEAAGARVRAEVLGVGPTFAPGPGSVESKEDRAEIDPETFETIRAGLVETVAVLAGLAAAGRFPLNDGSRVCSYCPYIRACRRTHAPTLERIEGAQGASDYGLLQGKSTRALTLADVRRRSAPPEAK